MARTSNRTSDRTPHGTFDRTLDRNVVRACIRASLCCALCFAAPLASVAKGQGASAAAAAPGQFDPLLQMAARASIIFAGQVESVTPRHPLGYVDVKFRIEEAVRGCNKTGAYVLREWAGLWTGHPERFHTGQRMIVLLQARGPSGLSAPVDGMVGVIPVVAVAQPPIAAPDGTLPSDEFATQEAAVDLRWVVAHGQRTPLPRAQTAYAGQPAQPVLGEPDPAVPLPGPASPAPVSPLPPDGTPAAMPTLSAVLAALRASGPANIGGRLAQ